MTFRLDILKKPTFDGTLEKPLEFDNAGQQLQITLQIKQDDEFNSAFAKVGTLLNEQKSINKNGLKRGNVAIDGNEALLFVIGEYCIKDWNVQTDDGILPINGDNLLLLLNNGFEQPVLIELITLLINTFAELMNEFSQKVGDIQKKPSANTNGKNKK
ncbi:hypothetical protein AAX06_01425 [Moraxella bovoculi]|uniref:Uncharacterized protein n=1 Tax=Moraxella bovoculi TaxID=386891 RepID=A0AAC8PUB3_9GAMM|nr:hypothetical protein [Moraxella bovoculi]AKG07060.1 hypothetical protein AAX06_01425 [Moraxella bovoculi]